MRSSTGTIRTIAIAAMVLFLAATSAHAQVPGPARGSDTDPFAKYFYPPEFVMQHQSEIGLTDAQRSSLSASMQQAQGKFIDAQFKLAGEGEKLQKLLQGTTVDEALTLEEMDRILSLERELKRAQVGLMVKIKNALTPAQQAKLSQLRQPRDE